MSLTVRPIVVSTVLASTMIVLATAQTVVAQAWPDKPVTIVVPFPAGGGTDTFARPLAAELSKSIGQTFVIDNRGGAGGTLGASIAAKAPKDGYTFFLGGVHHAIAPSVYPTLAYDIVKDFVPVAVVAVVPQVVVVNAELLKKAPTLKDLVAFAKSNPGKLTFGSPGTGTSHHLAGELFATVTGIKIRHVPYKGVAPAMQDIIGGQIDMMFDGLGSSATFIRANRVHALAVASKTRAPSQPDIPTAAEAGVAGYEVSSWYALWAVTGTPKEIIERMVSEVRKALATDAIKSTWAQQGATPGASNTAEMTDFQANEISRWGKLAKELNIQIQ